MKLLLSIFFSLLSFFVFADNPKKLKVVASFSVVGDMVREIAGDAIDLFVIVGPNTDTHIYQPKPQDVKNLKEADMLVMNGLGFESWLDRLIEASNFKGLKVIATEGIKANYFDESEKGTRIPDPHSWHSLKNGLVYVKNIAKALQVKDPVHAKAYKERAKAYKVKIKQLHQELTTAINEIPLPRRVVITSHDAFGYLGKEYGIKFISPLGISTEAEPAPQDVCKIVKKIKEKNIKAIFAEATIDKRLVQQISSETGIAIGGELLSDALSEKNGIGDSYLNMVKHNLLSLKKALSEDGSVQSKQKTTNGCIVQ